MGSGMISPTAPTAAGITPDASAARPARSVESSDQLLEKANPSTSDRQASVGIGPSDPRATGCSSGRESVRWRPCYKQGKLGTTTRVPAEQVTRPIRNREAPVTEPQLDD
jgi:hypothetical protein